MKHEGMNEIQKAKQRGRIQERDEPETPESKLGQGGP